MAMDPLAVSVQAALLTATPAPLAARRLGDFGWYLSHLVAVATLTALGAVGLLAAVTIFCLAAPVVVIGLVTAMHRRDARFNRSACG